MPARNEQMRLIANPFLKGQDSFDANIRNMNTSRFQIRTSLFLFLLIAILTSSNAQNLDKLRITVTTNSAVYKYYRIALLTDSSIVIYGDKEDSIKSLVHFTMREIKRIRILNTRDRMSKLITPIASATVLGALAGTGINPSLGHCGSECALPDGDNSGGPLGIIIGATGGFIAGFLTSMIIDSTNFHSYRIESDPEKFFKFYRIYSGYGN
jgi:hypothetical protein